MKAKACAWCLISQGPTPISCHHDLVGYGHSFHSLATSLSPSVLEPKYFVSTDHQGRSSSMILTTKVKPQCLRVRKSCLQSPIWRQKKSFALPMEHHTQELMRRSWVSQGLPMLSMKISGQSFGEWIASWSRSLWPFSFPSLH